MGKINPTLNLLVSHPIIDPCLITERLDIKPSLVQKYGAQIVTPKGNKVGGLYNWTKWGYSIELIDKENFDFVLLSLLEKLTKCQEFIHEMNSEGGEVIIYINITNPESMKMQLPLNAMNKFVDMKIKFGFEVFN